jgi:hypothetical protein
MLSGQLLIYETAFKRTKAQKPRCSGATKWSLKTMKKIVLVAILVSAPALAEPMHFEFIRNGGNCFGCAYTQATGEITSETAAQYEAFLKSLHRFYQSNALLEPSAKIFTGQDLDDTQKLTAALVFYVVKMGVDARLITLAAAAGPNEVYWHVICLRLPKGRYKDSLFITVWRKPFLTSEIY